MNLNIKTKYRLLFLTCVICSIASLGYAQELVSGKVTDQKGNGLADVRISGAAQDTTITTDDNGFFTLKTAGAIDLEFNLKGYYTKREKLSGSSGSNLIVILSEDPYQKIINVAYGKQGYGGLTAAISTISGEEMRKTPSANLYNTLYGRLPGLTVMQSSGEPGKDVPQMLIRGKGTYQNAGFLVLVDGFEASFDQFSVDEIESLSVLKDAAALVPFGIRGANGAILVTTKRGKQGKFRIGFNARTGVQQASSLPSFVNAYDYAQLYNEALTNDGLPVKYSQPALDAYRTGSDPYLYPDVNWYDEVLKKNAPISDYSLTFNGGNKDAKFFILLGHMNTKGLYAGTDPQRKMNSNADFRRFNFRSNVDVNLGKIFSASLDLSGRVEDRAFPGYAGDVLWNNLARYPANAFPVKNPDGSWGGTTIFPDNPVASVLDRGYTSSNQRVLIGTFRFNQNLDFITPGLKTSQAISINNYFSGSYDRTRSIATYELQNTATPTYRTIGATTSYGVSDGAMDQWNRTNLQFSINYDKQSGRHEVSSMLMYQQDVYAITGNQVPYAKQNIFGRVNYNFDSRYYAELGVSYSGSENFAKGKRFGVFPALSAAWVLSNESFLKNNGSINFLKVRGSIGLVGNDLLVGARFPYNQTFLTSGTYNLGSNNATVNTIMEQALANPDATWEKAMKYNIGIEGTLYKNLGISFDYFYENRYDISAGGEASVPAYIGVALPFQNIGRVANKGFELGLNYKNNEGKIGYFIAASSFFSRSKIKFMNEVIRANDYLYRTGKAIDQPFGLEALGLFRDLTDIANSPVQQFGPVQPGDIKYRDQNNDGVINQNDEIAIGKNWEPEFNFSSNMGLTFRSFDLELFFHAIVNRSVYRTGPTEWPLVNDANIPTSALNRWTPQNLNASYPRLTTSTNNNNYRRSTFWTSSGDALRLRSVEIGYNFPSGLTKKIKISSARIYVNGTNLFTLDNSDIMDPEVIGGYPPLKSYNIGIRLGF